MPGLILKGLLIGVTVALVAGCATPGDDGASAHGSLSAGEAANGQLSTVEGTAAYAAPNAFGMALLERVAVITPGKNVVLSPTSAATALRMAMEGAGGSTRQALSVALLAGQQSSRGNRERESTNSADRGGSGEITLTIANSLWGDAGVSFDSAFIGRLRRNYHADAMTVDLHSQAGIDRINAWASAATHGKIPIVLADPLPGAAVLLLANAVYFKGKWAAAFDATATRDKPFHLIGAGQHSVPMMIRDGEYEYLHENGLQVARLPYRGNRFAMYVLLPDANPAAVSVVKINASWLDSAARRMTPQLLALSLPRFRVEQTIDLKLPLTALGAGIAFDPDRADFSPMFTALQGAGRRTWIERAVQQVFIDVSEEGTEAAAVTAVTIGLDSGSAHAPIPFTADHPFYLVIRDDRTGELLFAGYVADPK